jgi:hypothetical protein
LVPVVLARLHPTFSVRMHFAQGVATVFLEVSRPVVEVVAAVIK